MRWLGLHLSQLPLDVFLRGQADPPAFAICRHDQIVRVSVAGRAAGVEPGQTRATALALLPDLILQERDLDAEGQALRQVANWALQFTPQIRIEMPDTRLPGAGHREAGLLLDIEASLNLFGGLAALQNQIRTGLRALGFAARIGCAPTPAAAWLAALWRDGLVIETEARLADDLAGLPIGLLASLGQHRHRETARSIGLRVLADLLKLPRNGLARRFGTPLLHELDQILGRRPDQRPFHEAPACFGNRLDLLADVTGTEALLFAIRRQLTELAGWLAARHGGIRLLRIDALHDRRQRGTSQPCTRIEARFASPTRDPERMLSVVRERLGRTPLLAPVHALALRCDDIVATTGMPASLFPTAQATEERINRLIERLRARLGNHQVQRIHLATDHRPESAYRIASPLPSAASPAAAPLSPLLARLPRPLWLLQQPVPLIERNQRPWRQGPLRLITGPERIEGGWWDEHLIQRDYFIAEDEQSQWLWIYRTRERSANGADGCTPAGSNQWFLQGMFG